MGRDGEGWGGMGEGSIIPLFFFLPRASLDLIRYPLDEQRCVVVLLAILNAGVH